MSQEHRPGHWPGTGASDASYGYHPLQGPGFGSPRHAPGAHVGPARLSDLEPPISVRRGVLLMRLGGVLALVHLITAAVVILAGVNSGGQPGTRGGSYAAIALAEAVIWFWLAHAAGRGRAWVRTAGTALFALLLVSTLRFLLAPLDPVGLSFHGLTLAVGAGALCFLWRRETSEYAALRAPAHPLPQAHLPPGTAGRH